MSLLDSFKDLVDDIPGGQGMMNSLQAASNVVRPAQLENLEKTAATLQEKITSLSTELASGQATPDHLTHLRTFLTSYQNALQAGGEPTPDPLTAARIKAMPQYQYLLDAYPALEQQVTALEQQYVPNH